MEIEKLKEDFKKLVNYYENNVDKEINLKYFSNYEIVDYLLQHSSRHQLNNLANRLYKNYYGYIEADANSCVYSNMYDNVLDNIKFDMFIEKYKNILLDDLEEFLKKYK